MKYGDTRFQNDSGDTWAISQCTPLAIPQSDTEQFVFTNMILTLQHIFNILHQKCNITSTCLQEQVYSNNKFIDFPHGEIGTHYNRAGLPEIYGFGFNSICLALIRWEEKIWQKGEQ